MIFTQTGVLQPLLLGIIAFPVKSSNSLCFQLLTCKFAFCLSSCCYSHPLAIPILKANSVCVQNVRRALSNQISPCADCCSIVKICVRLKNLVLLKDWNKIESWGCNSLKELWSCYVQTFSCFKNLSGSSSPDIGQVLMLRCPHMVQQSRIHH